MKEGKEGRFQKIFNFLYGIVSKSYQRAIMQFMSKSLWRLGDVTVEISEKVAILSLFITGKHLHQYLSIYLPGYTPLER